MKSKILLFVFFLLSVIHGQAQNWQEIVRDELIGNNLLSKIDADSYLDSVLICEVTIDSAQTYSSLLSERFFKIHDEGSQELKVIYLIELARVNQILNQQSESYRYIDQALVFSKENCTTIIQLKINRFGIKIARLNGDYLKAVTYLKHIEQLFLDSPESQELSDVMLDIAEYYWNMHEYENSMKYCQKVYPLLNYQKYQKGKIRALSIMYNNSHFTTSESSSTDYLDQALEIANMINDSVSLSEIYQNYGLQAYRNSDQTKAIDYYQLSRSYQRVKGSATDLHTAIYLQLSYTLIDSVEAVGRLSDFIIANAERNNFQNLLSNAYRGKAWYYAKLGKRDSAIIYLDAAFESRQLLDEKSDASPGFYYTLYGDAKLINDNQRALKFLTLAHNQYVEAQRKSNASGLNEIRANFDYQLQKEKIDRLTLQNKLEHELYIRQKLVLFAVLLLLILGIIFLIFARTKYSQLKETYQALVKKNLELDKLYKRLNSAENLQDSPDNGMTNGNGNEIRNEKEIYKKLKLLFEQKKIYKQSDISVSKLAKMLKTNTTYLSQIINNRFDESFKTVINKYRIDEARRLFSLPEFANYSIEGIAEEVGYQSRSTFYQSFKQITGLTPSQYLSNIKSIQANPEN